MIDDAFTFKVEVDLRLEMLSDQMDSKLVKVHVFKSDFIPYGCSANKKHSSNPLILCTGSACRICQCKLSVSKNMSVAFTTSAAEPWQ